ncbi:MAG TPA: hypothetical protein VG737_17005 [Cyclobacteriaceae bacterium]|nr:hypothetical protein [Cyclobacteriaceae bacterium]
MPSIIPGFEYDIFISYRHNDNKSGWVTEFVSALEEELASTIKEPLTIYFDKNPHDGLLETHDVDDSLKDKLKCLIFIPIISRTYCDTKSFAWKQEFLAFLQTGSIDTLGLKVKLPNGNTASRVLPIRIHELDANDKNTIETELQGALRAIDFTFHSAGVNRPLRPKDDDAIKVADQNSYRDQVNKIANAISDILEGLNGGTAPLTARSNAASPLHTPSRALPSRRNWRSTISRVDWKFATTVVAILSLLTLAAFHFSETSIPGKTYRTTLLPPESTHFNMHLGGSLALSPDGATLAFVAIDSQRKSFLWLRPLNALKARSLTGTEGAQFPFWSPDGRFIGFFADGKLKKVDVTGGMPQTLSEATIGRGGTWNSNGDIVFNAAASGPIFQISASGGKMFAITKLDTARGEISHRWPCFLPDGRNFLYTARVVPTGPDEKDAIFLASVDTSVAPRMITHGSSNLQYANGHILYIHQQTLMALPFDERSLQSTGEPIPIAEQIFFENISSHAAFSASQEGHLVYQNGTSRSGMKLAWWDRKGKKIGTVEREAQIYLQWRLSPDNEKLVLVQPAANGLPNDLWLYHIRKNTWARFTFDGATDRSPIWSPDGEKIVFASNRNKQFDLYQRASDREGSEELLLRSPDSKIPYDWSRDGKYIAYAVYNGSNINTNDIWILPVKSPPQKPFRFLETEFNESRPAFSPDGRWIAYQSNESGRDEVYIRPFPGPGGKWQVSSAGGNTPRWRQDGKELFFIGSGFSVMSAQIQCGISTVEIGNVQMLFDLEYPPIGTSVRDLYDVTRDGQRFLVELNQDSQMSMPITLVVNWPPELKKK